MMGKSSLDEDPTLVLLAKFVDGADTDIFGIYPKDQTKLKHSLRLGARLVPQNPIKVRDWERDRPPADSAGHSLVSPHSSRCQRVAHIPHPEFCDLCCIYLTQDR
jgi:hypothetical protein